MFHYNNLCFNGYFRTQKFSWSCITCLVSLKPFNSLSNKDLSNLVYIKQPSWKILSSKKNISWWNVDISYINTFGYLYIMFLNKMSYLFLFFFLHILLKTYCVLVYISQRFLAKTKFYYIVYIWMKKATFKKTEKQWIQTLRV